MAGQIQITDENLIWMENQINTFKNLKGELKYEEYMSNHTSWRVGGPADKFYTPADIDDLSMFISQLDDEEEVIWLGLGSNLLVRDGGIRGTVISISGVLDELNVLDKNIIRVGAGVSCAKTARFSAVSGLSGAEFFAGIPGTVGGALAMNAGAFGGETWQIVSKVEMLDRNGKRSIREKDEFKIAYRSVVKPKDEWFISADLNLQQDTEKKGMENIREMLSMRNASQPTGVSSCGSVFRNPEGDYAGRLIEKSNLKEYAIGNASVSAKHANFIINNGGASASEIEALILHIQETVKKKFKVTLKPEVQIIGEH